MKNKILPFLNVIAFGCMAFILITGCNDDNDPDASLTGRSKSYVLLSAPNSFIAGTIKFSERNDHSTIVTIDLEGTTSSNEFVAQIKENSAAERGEVLLDLNSIEGSSGRSETLVSQLNDGKNMPYSDLIMLNGHIDILLDKYYLGNLIAQGDIGENELTETYVTYDLYEVNDSGIQGTATFAKRVSGTTLVTVNLSGAIATLNYPIYICEGDDTAAGAVAINLAMYNCALGSSETTIRKFNNNVPIDYDQLKHFNSHISVGKISTYVAVGNIGL